MNILTICRFFVFTSPNLRFVVQARKTSRAWKWILDAWIIGRRNSVLKLLYFTNFINSRMCWPVKGVFKAARGELRQNADIQSADLLRWFLSIALRIRYCALNRNCFSINGRGEQVPWSFVLERVWRHIFYGIILVYKLSPLDLNQFKRENLRRNFKKIMSWKKR